MAQLFISHAEEDRASAIEIGDALAQKGFSVWLYERDPVPGPPYLVQVSEAIAECEGVILLISQASMESHQVDAEVALAFDSRKRFVPVLSGISYDDFRKQKPDWWLALRAATSVTLPPAGASAILDQLESGVKRLGINPAAPPTDDKDEAPKNNEEPSAPPLKVYRRAYLCYEWADREEVFRRAAALYTSGMLILNVPAVEGDKSWGEATLRKIGEADVFYLFWSQAAANSAWIDYEIDLALRRRRDAPGNRPEIILVALSENAPPLPPRFASLLTAAHLDNTLKVQDFKKR